MLNEFAAALKRRREKGRMTDLTQDIDPIESQEWQDAISDVIERDGANRAHYLLDKAVQQARAAGAQLPFSATTPYQNTIPEDDEVDVPGDHLPGAGHLGPTCTEP